jgi:hypothetical protein
VFPLSTIESIPTTIEKNNPWEHVKRVIAILLSGKFSYMKDKEPSRALSINLQFKVLL